MNRPYVSIWESFVCVLLQSFYIKGVGAIHELPLHELPLHEELLLHIFLLKYIQIGNGYEQQGAKSSFNPSKWV